jgi:hypothetical protein
VGDNTELMPAPAALTETMGAVSYRRGNASSATEKWPQSLEVAFDRGRWSKLKREFDAT